MAGGVVLIGASCTSFSVCLRFRYVNFGYFFGYLICKLLIFNRGNIVLFSNTLQPYICACWGGDFWVVFACYRVFFCLLCVFLIFLFGRFGVNCFFFRCSCKCKEAGTMSSQPQRSIMPFYALFLLQPYNYTFGDFNAVRRKIRQK